MKETLMVTVIGLILFWLVTEINTVETFENCMSKFSAVTCHNTLR